MWYHNRKINECHGETVCIENVSWPSFLVCALRLVFLDMIHIVFIYFYTSFFTGWMINHKIFIVLLNSCDRFGLISPETKLKHLYILHHFVWGFTSQVLCVKLYTKWLRMCIFPLKFYGIVFRTSVFFFFVLFDWQALVRASYPVWRQVLLYKVM